MLHSLHQKRLKNPSMFKHLARHSVILVTGPQRAGTTICARIIAADTGHEYIDENEYGPHNKTMWLHTIACYENVVVHCPAMCRYVHEVGGVFVVMAYRNVADIANSQERIGWGKANEALELARYKKAEDPVAAIKYDFWRKYQRTTITNWLEVEYKNLAAHPLWIDKRERATFGPRQTERAV